MKTILKSSPSLSEVGQRAYTPSTLLVPMKLLKYFNNRVHFFGGRKHYFEYLIVTYGRHLSSFRLNPTTKKWKMQYQEEGLDLQKRNFKPDPVFWEEFRHIGLAYGLTMCHLFVVLLELEYKRWIESGCSQDYYEIFPGHNQLNNLGMNSSQNITLKSKKTLEHLVVDHNYTLLIRSIDFNRLQLHRIGLIR